MCISRVSFILKCVMAIYLFICLFIYFSKGILIVWFSCRVTAAVILTLLSCFFKLSSEVQFMCNMQIKITMLHVMLSVTIMVPFAIQITMICTVESRLLEPPRETKICLRIGQSEKSRVKMKRLTKEGKRLLVRVIGSFEKLRVREIGIPLYNQRVPVEKGNARAGTHWFLPVLKTCLVENFPLYVTWPITMPTLSTRAVQTTMM